MKHKLHLSAVNGGAFNCRPADTIELDGADILANDVHLPFGGFNPHNVKLWVVGNEYGPLAAVWASCEQDALDELTDAGKLDSFLVSEEDQEKAAEEEREEWAHLGNAGEPADLSYAWMREVELVPSRDCQLLCAFAYADGAGESTL